MIAFDQTNLSLLEARNWGRSLLADSDSLMTTLDGRLAGEERFAVLLDFRDNDGTSENHPEQAMRHMRWMGGVRERMGELCAGVVYVTAPEKLTLTRDKTEKTAPRMWGTPVYVTDDVEAAREWARAQLTHHEYAVFTTRPAVARR